jgi:hypothetical protein
MEGAYPRDGLWMQGGSWFLIRTSLHFGRASTGKTMVVQETPPSSHKNTQKGSLPLSQNMGWTGGYDCNVSLVTLVSMFYAPILHLLFEGTKRPYPMDGKRVRTEDGYTHVDTSENASIPNKKSRKEPGVAELGSPFLRVVSVTQEDDAPPANVAQELFALIQSLRDGDDGIEEKRSRMMALQPFLQVAPLEEPLPRAREPLLRFTMILDGVHNNIEFERVCMQIINTPQFQRLRSLKQLGTTFYVFPSATHTRFEHSLGVAHLAETVCRCLQREQAYLGITER